MRLSAPAIIAVMPADVDSHRTPGPNFLVAGRYRLVSRIGGGGMGTVWLARDQLLDREVAVKQVLSTEGLSEDSAETVRQRAMREGRIAARLSHRNAIAMHDVALDGGEPWLAHVALMEAHAAAGNPEAALARAQWLATHRGRAYAEFSTSVMIPYNVAQSTLALLRTAELQHALGQDPGAALRAFEAAWPGANGVPTFAARISA